VTYSASLLYAQANPASYPLLADNFMNSEVVGYLYSAMRHFTRTGQYELYTLREVFVQDNIII